MAKELGPVGCHLQGNRIIAKHEIYGLTSQMRRVSVSIASNIAEGAGRRTSADLPRFLNIARGSAHELETQIMTAQKLLYFDAEKTNDLQFAVIEIEKMISGLQKAL